nr:immunoglobulin light chain junction region [Macaca mulatta]MOW15421.1 immunoglobulin light chain junction region [Macaca mulatta]MOW15698.1 immunoglobulin light chain junction region [Macaca mulatta]MOW16524.1 immunoglobulin light chain junction region [Macaca mulatta]MOW16586.1 immunoglobulin light chain junction region [Macaca mulatta]
DYHCYSTDTSGNHGLF